jgi:hypothetical protein
MRLHWAQAASLVVLVVFAVARPARAADEPAGLPELRKLRALLVIDSSSNLAVSVAHDRKTVETMLRSYVPADRLTVDVIDGTKVTRENILKHYRDLKTGRDEALLFFYAGHGAFEREKGQVLQPQMGKTPVIPRADVRRAMEDRKPGLVVLLTDCCSTYLRARPKRLHRKANSEPQLHPVLRCLFFQHRGTVDITAAEDGTASFGDDQHGGVFSNALVNLLESDLKRVDRDGDRFVTWKEFFPQVVRQTEKDFQDFAARARAAGEEVEQKTQRPHSFALPEAPARPAVAKPTYAVVTLLNDSGSALSYRYRWSGEKEWKEDALARGGRKVHSRPVEGGAKLPDFEIKVKSENDDGHDTLRPAKWSGTTRPTYEDGNEYKVYAR